MAAVVEAEPVDDAALVDEAEYPWLRVSGLRERRHGADLGEPAAEPEDGIGDAGVLVEAGGDRDGVGQGEATEARRQRRRIG